LTTPHGVVDTPAFMPVGTRGTVKGVTPAQLRDCGCQLVLANTYHLLLRPGVQVVERLGGLHEFTGWDGAMLTDSGGFQVFSLAPLRQISEEGVWFSSHVDGQRLFLSPQEAVSVQNRLGADLIMAFDHCPPWPADAEQVRHAVDRTIRWARASLEAHNRAGQWLFGIVQGGTDLGERDRCLEQLLQLGFDGYAIGGLSVGEPAELRERVVRHVTPALPQDKPRYLMGVGTPLDIIEAVSAGVDLFDCVLPTRNGRNGYAFTWSGPVRIRNEKHKVDTAPLDRRCGCYTCRHFSRGYVRHLFLSDEMLGPILVSVHNIAFYQDLMHHMRVAIEGGTFSRLLQQVRGAYGSVSD